MSGCTAVPDLKYQACCDIHDVRYELHTGPDGRPCTRFFADYELWA